MWDRDAGNIPIYDKQRKNAESEREHRELVSALTLVLARFLSFLTCLSRLKPEMAGRRL